MQSQQFNFESSRLPVVEVRQASGLIFIERDDVRIACDFEPPASGAPADQFLLLINGFARPRADFRAFRKRIHAQMPRLATVAMDNRGAGETEGGIAELTVLNMALDSAFVAQSFAAALGLRGYNALGISMGGMIAQTWAAQDTRVNSLTLVSTTAGGLARVWPDGVNGDEARRKPFEPWPQDAEVMHRRMSRYFGPKFRASSPLLIEIMVKNMLKSQTGEGAQGRAKAQYNATVAFDGTAFAAQVSCPTLVLTGTHDEVIPPENSTEICRLMPHARLQTFADMGHLLLIEDPENFVAQVRTFLEGIER